MNNQPDVSKLPRWAQERIMVLTLKAERLAAVVDTLRGNPSPIEYCHRTTDNRFFIPEGSNVYFTLPGNGLVIDCMIDHEGTFRLYADNMRIVPRAANSIYIESA